MISAAILIPYHSDVVPMIAHVVEAEPAPFAVGQYRTYHEAVVSAGLQTAYTRYDEVVEGGMVIVSAALLVAFEPVARCLIEILAYIRTPSVALALHVFLHLREEERVVLLTDAEAR